MYFLLSFVVKIYRNQIAPNNIMSRLTKADLEDLKTTIMQELNSHKNELKDIKLTLNNLRKENEILDQHNKNLEKSVEFLKTKVLTLETQNQNITNTVNQNHTSIIPNLEGSIDSKLKSLEDKFLSKVNKQKSSLNANIKSYAAAVTDKNCETNSALNNLNIEINSLKSNLEYKTNLEKETSIKNTKANNVIVFNVPESNGTNKESYKNDILKTRTIFSKLNLEKDDVNEIFRVGKLGNNTNPRPIIIKFNNLEKRKQLLQLRDVTYTDDITNTIITIYTSIDRTKQEQIIHKKLVDEKKLRTNNGEKNLYIRNNKIVTILPFRPNPHEYWDE